MIGADIYKYPKVIKIYISFHAQKCRLTLDFNSHDSDDLSNLRGLPKVYKEPGSCILIQMQEVWNETAQTVFKRQD